MSFYSVQKESFLIKIIFGRQIILSYICSILCYSIVCCLPLVQASSTKYSNDFLIE